MCWGEKGIAGVLDVLLSVAGTGRSECEGLDHGDDDWRVNGDERLRGIAKAVDS